MPFLAKILSKLIKNLLKSNNYLILKLLLFGGREGEGGLDLG